MTTKESTLIIHLAHRKEIFGDKPHTKSKPFATTLAAGDTTDDSYSKDNFPPPLAKKGEMSVRLPMPESGSEFLLIVSFLSTR